MGHRALVVAAAAALTLALTPAPGVAKPPPPAQDRDNCARADATHYTVYVGNQPYRGESDTGDLSTTGEVVAYACQERVGRKVTMRYGWSSVGRLNVAVFNFRLMDCATGESVPGTERKMSYPKGTKERAAEDVATFEFPKDRKIRPHVYGAGEYQRANQTMLESGIGRFNTWEDPKFLADGVCR